MEIKQENQIEIYKNINFYNRYKSISNSNQFENTFENFSKEEVLNIIKKIGYIAKYYKKGNFFEIKEVIKEVKFYFNINLKYGLVELIIGATNVKTNSFIMGGVFGHISDEIKQSQKTNNEEKIYLPSFRNYDDLELILKDAFSIYEDFKNEIVNQE
jgi:hypothetical protein